MAMNRRDFMSKLLATAAAGLVAGTTAANAATTLAEGSSDKAGCKGKGECKSKGKCKGEGKAECKGREVGSAVRKASCFCL